MTNQPMTRRTMLKGGASLAGALALGRRLSADTLVPGERPALVVFWLNGGPAGLFNSAGSFLRSGAFGVTASNTSDLGNGLFVDAGSLGTLPVAARRNMASINFRHEIVRPHEHARAAVLQAGARSQLLRTAAAMPDGPIRCAVVNDLGLPKGVESNPASEGGVSFDRIVDFAGIERGLVAGRERDVRAVYGVPRDAKTVCDQRATFAAVEMLVRGGANVIFAQPAYTGRADRQFDTHEDDAGVEARAVMAPITPSLATFLERVLALPERNVVTLLVGEFSRTMPKSDHEPGGTATVIGKYVKTGTAGPQRPDGSPPSDAPPPEALWAYTSAALRLGSAPFGRNPSPELIV